MSKTQLPAAKVLAFMNQKYHTDYKYGPDDIILRKEAIASNVSTLDESTATVECVISTDDIDRQGDMVIPAGLDITDYVKNPKVLFNHDHSLLPVAKCTEITVKNNKVVAKVQFAVDTTLGGEIYKLVKGGFLKALSIGFAPTKMLTKGTRDFVQYVKENGIQASEDLQRVIQNWMLYEFSFVNIPANADCLTKALAADPTEHYAALQKYLKIDVKEEEQDVPVEVTTEVKEDAVTEVAVVAVVAVVVPEVKAEVTEVKTDPVVEVKRFANIIQKDSHIQEVVAAEVAKAIEAFKIQEARKSGRAII